MKTLFSFLFVLLLTAPALAAQHFDYAAFGHIPVQHEGRIKPLDTLARNFLYNFSGHETLDGIGADAWLAETLFDPAQALHRPVFRILRPDLLDLPVRGRKYYSYAELAPALQRKAGALEKIAGIDDKDLSRDQAEMIRIQESVMLYGQLLRSFSLILPLNISIPGILAREWKISPDTPFTVQEFRRFDARLQNRVAAIVRNKGDDLSRYTEDERDIALFAFDMKVLEQAGENNILLRIVPGQWDGANGEWFSPWAIMQTGQGSAKTADYLQTWKDMAAAYLQRDAKSWNDASSKADIAAREFAPSYKLSLEYFYNAAHLLTSALLLYLGAFLAFIFLSMNVAGPWRIVSLTALTGGALFHAATIILRILILSRPPVGTLYESILFVAFICVFAAIALEGIKKNGNGLAIGSISGMLLLFIAESFAQDDTMKMLVAVLNTNFWLSTHVLCITMGYGWCLVVSLLAHLWLVRKAFNKDNGDLVISIKTLTLIALLFTSVGTILGGIWADQSWGRFWGWDPKENGALLIVLWLIWVLHAQISGHLNRLNAIALLAALSMVVAIAWFGVNLLSVGLHSYGFITGVAAGLAAFLALESCIITGLYWKITKNGTAA